MGRKGGGIRCCDSGDVKEAVTWHTHAMLVYDFLLSKKERSSLSINHIDLRLNIMKEKVSSLSTGKERSIHERC